MARPKKHTVDYFPHTCVHGKTLYILEQKYGNDGYAFWFKLLEMLGSSKGHYLDLSEEATYVFLQAKTRTNEELCSEMLDLLCKLGAIDIELWKQKKIIWCQNFVDGIADVYKNRRIETPEKPNFSFYKEKPSKDAVSTADNPQTKVKESKEKESKTTHIQKHKYGEYKNVLLKDEEYQKLLELESGKEAIEFLSEYIEMKGYKAKSHYLAIKKWVFDALKGNRFRKSNTYMKKEKPLPDWYEGYEKQLENIPKNDKELSEEEIDKVLEEAKKFN